MRLFRYFHLIPLLLALIGATAVRAGTTDIAQAPLITSATNAVLPNLLFVIDDSGSMGYDYMPDWANDNYCKRIGSYTGNCCVDNNLNSPGNDACWVNSLTATAPFGTFRGAPPFLAAQFNSLYYNPAITYTPPLNADGTSRQSQTSANTTGWTVVKNDAYNVQNTKSTNLLTSFPDQQWCTDSNYTDCLRNDNYLLPGVVNGKTYGTVRATVATGTGPVATGSPAAPTTATRSFGPHYYTILPGEYCDGPDLRICQKTASAAYTYAAPLRWCRSENDATAATSNPTATQTLCQAVQTSVFKYARYSTKYSTPADPGSAYVPAVAAQPAVAASVSFSISSFSCTGSKVRRLDDLTVGGVSLLTATGGTGTSNTALATLIRNNFNSANYTLGGSGVNFTLTQKVPSASTASVAISAGQTGNGNGSCGNVTLNPATPKLSGYVAAVAYVPAQPAVAPTPAGYYGSFVRTDLVPAVNSYPYPGTNAKAGTRTDCAGATCTYAEEMTNFANWWTYYHTRMQTMKSSASLAFAPIDTRYRVGYMSIDNNTGADFLNFDKFDATQKGLWYGKLFAAIPGNSTPLRQALTNAGRIYAGKWNGVSFNGSTVKDPMQYSCQQNFTILSTDGYWNDADPGGRQLDGSTAVGNQDGSAARPILDGNNISNTLADTAAYYYNTDLRTTTLNNCTGAAVAPATTGQNVCLNNVPASGRDTAAHQHMTTFTVGLGLSGYMQYSPSYLTATDGDFFAVKNGTAANPAAGICAWQTSGQCNWPTPVSNTLTTIDDLWHAAVNGSGTYFSANSPAALSSGLSSALAGVASRTGDSAAATTSNPNVATGDNFVFSSTFTSVQWDGQLLRQQLDVNTGALSATPDWSAQALLDANVTRKIYTYDPNVALTRLRELVWTGLPTSMQAYFSLPNIASLSQFCAAGTTCLPPGQQAQASGENLLNFLRGDRSNEGAATDTSTYFRQRSHVLGDIVNSEAVYVKTPQFNYTENDYSAFQALHANTNNASRRGMVYVGANDGMLHGFDAGTGQELWAYVPSLVLPNLYKLADKSYAGLHRYFVDGTPVQGDVYFGGAWHTILVGGLNGGGRGYYALDITDPENPKALWEFVYDTSKGFGYTTDANLGLTFGKPEISKRKDGTWVVLLTSGYNNLSPGDGKGYLYVLNAQTGAKVATVSTGVGDDGSTASSVGPSGLAQIHTWTDNGMYDNTAQRVYGGDLLGNMWRFDIDDNIAPAGNEAQLLATVKNAANQVQPITVRPALGEVNGTPVVYFGTGRYLGTGDLNDTTGQTLYAMKDRLGTDSYGNPRSDPKFIAQVLTATTCPAGSPASICSPGQNVRTSTNNAVNFASDYGWYVDLIDAGERSFTDPQLQLGTLGYSTNVLNSSACTVGGYSYQYFFDYRTGGPVSTSTTGVVATQLGNALATRPVFARLPNNQVFSIVRLSDGTTLVPPVPIGNVSSSTRRVSWRELNTQ
jgi:type IV pilus assembly protein PilY1